MEICPVNNTSFSSSSASQGENVKDTLASESSNYNDTQTQNDEEVFQEIDQKLINKEVEPNGYFIYYGNNNYEPLKWIYISRSLRTIKKLDGARKDGSLKWKDLAEKYKAILQDGKIVLQKK